MTDINRNEIELRLIRAEAATEVVDVIAWATGPAREDVRALIGEVDRLAGKTAEEWRAETRKWLAERDTTHSEIVRLLNKQRGYIRVIKWLWAERHDLGGPHRSGVHMSDFPHGLDKVFEEAISHDIAIDDAGPAPTTLKVQGNG